MALSTYPFAQPLARKNDPGAVPLPLLGCCYYKRTKVWTMRKTLTALLLLSSMSANAEMEGSVHRDITHSFKHSEQECMALNIYFEARSQSYMEKMGVFWVTMNRVEAEEYPNDICSVVKQKHQFSWYWDGKKDSIDWNDPLEVQAWKSVFDLSDSLLKLYDNDMLEDVTSGADHYHAHYILPHWAEEFEVTTAFDGHIYYTSTPISDK